MFLPQSFAPVSDCGVPEMPGIGLRSVLVVRKQADNAADSGPRDR